MHKDIYGLLSVGDMEVAIPLSSLREVLKRPSHFAALPQTSDALLGAMELRSSIIPVADLTAGLGIARSGGTPGIVVIVGAEDRLIGPVIDTVRGVMRMSRDEL